MKTAQGQHPLTDDNAVSLITNVVLLSDFYKKQLIDEYHSLRKAGYAEGKIYLYVPARIGARCVIDLRKRVGYAELYA